MFTPQSAPVNPAGACAAEAAGLIDALAIVFAWVICAGVWVEAADLAKEAGGAVALEVGDEVGTGPTVEAWVVLTVIDVFPAILTRIASLNTQSCILAARSVSAFWIK